MRSALGVVHVRARVGCLRVMPWRWSGTARPGKDMQMRSAISGSCTSKGWGCLRVMPWRWSGTARPQTKDMQRRSSISGSCTVMAGVGCLDALAVEWCRKAADQGDAQAQHNLGAVRLRPWRTSDFRGAPVVSPARAEGYEHAAGAIEQVLQMQRQQQQGAAAAASPPQPPPLLLFLFTLARSHRHSRRAARPR